MKNLRQTGSGWQKYARVQGRFVSEHTAEKPTPADVRQWVRRQHLHEPDTATEDAPATAFEADVRDYLESVTAMPSFTDRQLHMREWAAHFRGRGRDTVKALEIRTRLQQLRSTLSASSCNKRRTALMSFYTSLNGRSGYNPVRDVPKFPEEQEPRAQRVSTVLLILRHMRPSQTRVRLLVILWTGWPHAQLKRLKPAHLDLQNARAFVTPRRKGKGRQGTWLQLLPQAVKALREFVAWDCFTPMKEVNGKLVPKPFSHHSMHKSFALAVSKVNERRAKRKLPPLDVHPYDLRHTFGTWVADRTTDERAIQELMMHSRGEQTRRYTEGATMRRVATAVATLSKSKKSA